MSGLQAIADRFEIEAVRGEFTDAAMMGESDRFTSLFTQDGAWRIPDINEKFVSRGKTRAGIEWLQGGVGDTFERLPYRNLEDVAAVLRDAMHDLETFEWRGVDLLWGRKS